MPFHALGSTVRAGSDEKSSDSTSKIFIALFSICIVVIVVLGVIVGYLWKDRQRWVKIIIHNKRFDHLFYPLLCLRIQFRDNIWTSFLFIFFLSLPSCNACRPIFYFTSLLHNFFRTSSHSFTSYHTSRSLQFFITHTSVYKVSYQLFFISITDLYNLNITFLVYH